MGNRGGRIHRPDRTLGRARWASRQWIACLLEFKGRHREVMAPNRYTELFFLDEATALAAGHRPCFECRRGDALAFRTAWMRAFGLEAPASAAEMDRVLHASRPASGTPGIPHRVVVSALPDGAMVELEPAIAALVVGGRLHRWSFDGYSPYAETHQAGDVAVLTPGPIIAVLRNGYRPTDWLR